MYFKNQQELNDLLLQKRPDVLSLIGNMTFSELLPVLNKITGCSVKGNDSIDYGMGIHIAALKNKKTIMT